MELVRELGQRGSGRSGSRMSAGVVLAALAAATLLIPCSPKLDAREPAPPGQSLSSGRRPGARAQLRVGTSDLSVDSRVLSLLADHRFRAIQAQLSQLPPDLAQFYRGILLNRSNQLEQSIQMLSPLVDSVAQSGNFVRKKLIREALAEDYLRLDEWSRAADAYQALDTRMKDKLTADELDEIEIPLKLLPLAKDNPRVTVEPQDPFKLPVSEDPLGLVDIPVSVDGRARNWILDPTLPFSFIARSTAKDAGLTISDGEATITTLTGRPIPIHATVIPRFTIGGRLTLHDMTAFVYEDKDYYFPQTSYQVEGVLGYPVLAAMGSLTVNSDNTIFVRPAKQLSPPEPNDLLTTGTRFYLDGGQVIVAFGHAAGTSEGNSPPQSVSGAAGHGTAGVVTPASPANAADDERMFAVDAGAQQTYFTSRYFDEHVAEFKSQQMEMFSLLGGESPPQPAYNAESVVLEIGGTSVTLHFIHVLTKPLNSAAPDDVYGTLGTDSLGQLKSYTFDYRTMRFAVTTQ